MSIKRFPNDFGGESVLVSPGASLDDVPAPFAGLLTAEHRAAFSAPADYFRALASQCAIATMKTWLERLADAGPCKLEVNMSGWSQCVIAHVDRFRLSLRKPVRLPPPGDSLKQLYSLILATYHDGFADAGGLHEPRTVEHYGLTIESDIDVPADAVAFFTSAGGDSVIAINEAAYWCGVEF
jgi:hypothetical protein